MNKITYNAAGYDYVIAATKMMDCRWTVPIYTSIAGLLLGFATLGIMSHWDLGNSNEILSHRNMLIALMSMASFLGLIPLFILKKIWPRMRYLRFMHASDPGFIAYPVISAFFIPVAPVFFGIMFILSVFLMFGTLKTLFFYEGVMNQIIWIDENRSPIKDATLNRGV